MSLLLRELTVKPLGLESRIDQQPTSQWSPLQRKLLTELLKLLSLSRSGSGDQDLCAAVTAFQ